jgi:hypothetical protein
MKQIEKLKTLSKSVLNEKDYSLVVKFIDNHDFDSFSDLIRLEIKKEAKECASTDDTPKLLTLQKINILLERFDLSDMYMDKCANYEEE